MKYRHGDSGWLGRNGQFHRCEYYEHSLAAEELLSSHYQGKKNNQNLPPDECLMRLGWVRVTGFPSEAWCHFPWPGMPSTNEWQEKWMIDNGFDAETGAFIGVKTKRGE